ncbi:MAG TPA: hypothetical protein PKK23_07600 [Nitrospirales bacterium]|nr:hypothetical protein [Nitrospirales bacterium]
MPFQRCPQCQNSTLVPTGAFWCCTNCESAITSQALVAMRKSANIKTHRHAHLVHRTL